MVQHKKERQAGDFVYDGDAVEMIMGKIVELREREVEAERQRETQRQIERVSEGDGEDERERKRGERVMMTN